MPESIRACAGQQDDKERLACYDREIARADRAVGLSDAQQKKAKHLIDDQNRSAAAKKEPAGHLSTDDTIEPQARVTPPQPPSLTSHVSAVTQRSDGRKVIALENGQTWLQGEAFDQTEIVAGDSASIKPGLLGSLYLILPKGRTRVTRLR